MQVGSTLLILLFGTTIASCHFLKNILSGHGLNHVPLTYSTPGELPQFMPHLLPGGRNILYKPQFIIPPVIDRLMRARIDCVKDDLQYYIPVVPDMAVQKPIKPKEYTVVVPAEPEVIIEQKPIQIPQPPVLPPFTMPEIPIFVEEPQTQEKKENCKPMEIPAPPVLPKMPELPIPENIDIFPEHFPIVPVISGTEPSPAPELTVVEIPEPPVLPPLSLPELPVPILTEVIPENKPAIIPEGPTLPPFVNPPLPEIIVEENHPSELPKPEVPPTNCIYEIPESAPHDIEIPELRPVEIPEPPVLPPFTMPELPTFPEPEPAIEIKPIEIPAPPVLPPAEFVKVPVYEPIVQDVDCKPTDVIQIPPSPVLPPLEIPAPLPNIVETPQVIELTPKETPPVILQVPQRPSVTEVISELCDNNEIIPENKPILILEQIHPVAGVTTQQVVPEVMELNVGGAKVTVPSLASLSFPNFCVQNLIIDRALPSMIIGDKYHAERLAPYVAGQHSVLPMFQYYKR